MMLRLYKAESKGIVMVVCSGDRQHRAARRTSDLDTTYEAAPSIPRPRVVKESGDSGVELKQAAESVATANGPALGT